MRTLKRTTSVAVIEGQGTVAVCPATKVRVPCCLIAEPATLYEEEDARDIWTLFIIILKIIFLLKYCLNYKN